MNVFKHKLFLFYFIILLGLPSALSAQVQSIRADIYQGEQYDQHIVNSIVLPAFITKQSANGKASWIETGTTTGRPGFNTLLYTPNAGFVGKDTIKITYYRQAALATNQDVVVTVLRSEVTAVDDFEETNQNQAVTIDVLSNDFLTNGTLKVKEILVANQAMNVTINVDGTITYFPVAGFSGVANLSYLVCNEIDICDVATVSIAVENTTPNRIDTLSIVTTKNTTVPVLLPIEGYTLSQSPSKGTLDDSADVVYYIPNPNTIGKDKFVYQSDTGNGSKVVLVNVLDAKASNTFAIDDYVYTPVGQAVEINVVENDQDVAQTTIVRQPAYGKLSTLNSGVVTYTPNNGFTTFNEYTVDRFTYRATLANGTFEEATVFVYVNNFNPSNTTYELTAIKNSPLALQYAVPIDYKEFVIVSQGAIGKVTFYPSINAIVYGQKIVGEKVLLYVPTQGATGLDEFEVQYCVSDNPSSCKSIKIKVNILDVVLSDAEKCVLDGCVWEGDANNDGTVNMVDLLTLGQHIGKIGATRGMTANNLWYGKYAQDWTSANLKYTDTDGNGVISGKDTTGISTFYSRKHKITPTPMPQPNPLPIYYGKPDTIPLYGPGSTLEIPIILGSEYYTATDIYGLNFEVNYSPTVFRAGSGKIIFDQDSWLSYGSPVLELSKEQSVGKIEAGFSRTDNLSRSGYGRVARFTTITEKDLDGWRDGNEEVIIPLSITATAINGAGQSIALGTDTYALKIVKTANGEDGVVLEEIEAEQEALTLFPNPTAEVLFFDKAVERVEIFTLTGQKVFEAANVNQIQVKSWNQGIYLVRARLQNGEIINKKFEVVE